MALSSAVNFQISRAVTIPAVAVGGAFFVFYCYRKLWCHRYFKARGIPGPEPHWFWGNMKELWVNDRHKVMQQMAKKYGDFWGYYEGPTPVLVTSNLEAVERINIKQFSEFQGHNLMAMAPDPSEKDSDTYHMLWAIGDEWKRLRTAANPAFSTGKLKSYTPLIALSQAKLISILDDKANKDQSFDIRAVFQLLTLDVIGEVAFGCDLKALETNGEGNEILVELRALMDMSSKPNKIDEIARAFPPFLLLLKPLVRKSLQEKKGPLKCIGSLLDLAGSMIESRRNNPDQRRTDLIQMMIDAPTLNDREVKAMSFLFLSAGYETTSSMLGWCAYALATNKNCQDKLRNEILEQFPEDNTDLNYDNVGKSVYLDWICKETLRLYPIASGVINRFVMNETELCGIHLTPQCKSVLVDIYTIHMDENNWGPVDPNKFYPERFGPNSIPEHAFLAFGIGPRQCIGMRMALFEMKLTLINVLRRFEILPPIEGYPKGGIRVSSRESLFIPVNGVSCRLRKI